MILLSRCYYFCYVTDAAIGNCFVSIFHPDAISCQWVLTIEISSPQMMCIWPVFDFAFVSFSFATTTLPIVTLIIFRFSVAVGVLFWPNHLSASNLSIFRSNEDRYLIGLYRMQSTNQLLHTIISQSFDIKYIKSESENFVKSHK